MVFSSTAVLLNLAAITGFTGFTDCTDFTDDSDYTDFTDDADCTDFTDGSDYTDFTDDAEHTHFASISCFARRATGGVVRSNPALIMRNGCSFTALAKRNI